MTAADYVVSVIRATGRVSRVLGLITALRLALRRFAVAIVASVLVGAVITGLVLSPFRTLVTIWLSNAVLMVAVSFLTLSRMLYTWHRPERNERVAIDLGGPANDAEGAAAANVIAAPELTFSLIVPARHEPILERTLHNLLACDYPRSAYQVVVVIGEDDPETAAIAERVEASYDNVLVVTDSSPVKSKPRALEVARPYCTGELIGVVDAESLLAHSLLSHVNTVALANPEIGIFQGGVQLMNNRATKRPDGVPARRGLRGLLAWANTGTSWWRARNCLEYYVWFMSRMRYQQHVDFVPLGGNTVFVRTDVLSALGGWDPDCLTEDCELGVRASARGVRPMVVYRPELVTREETPDSLSALIVQRSRWMSGFVQVWRKGEWKQLPRRQQVRAFETLTMPFFQAYTGLAAVLSVVLVFTLRAPVGAVMFTWMPLLVMSVGLAFEQAAYREFTETFQLRSGVIDSLRLVLSGPVYQFVLSAAAIRTMVRLSLGNVSWEKTAHSGLHMGQVDAGRLTDDNSGVLVGVAVAS
jgi:cellulose synthase/poly-beta-1,6-N-acetylglucosamine synthase-like glycosyltransferase